MAGALYFIGVGEAKDVGVGAIKALSSLYKGAKFAKKEIQAVKLGSNNAINSALAVLAPERVRFVESLPLGGYTYTKTAFKHVSELAIKGQNKGMLSRAYMKSPLVLREIIEFTKGQPDKFLPGATCWKVPGNYRGGSGTWELVTDTEKKVISHFNFVRDK